MAKSSGGGGRAGRSGLRAEAASVHSQIVRLGAQRSASRNATERESLSRQLAPLRTRWAEIRALNEGLANRVAGTNNRLR